MSLADLTSSMSVFASAIWAFAALQDYRLECSIRTGLSAYLIISLFEIKVGCY